MDMSSDWIAENGVSLVILCATIVLAILGNLRLIVYIYNTWKRVRRIMRINFFLINLAVGDICVGVLVCSAELVFVIFGSWTLGNVMCKITVYVQFVCLASAAFLLLVMSIDRYEVIVKPLSSIKSRPRVVLRIVSCWVLALIFATPQLFIFRTVEVSSSSDNGTVVENVTVCKSSGYTAEWQRKVYIVYVCFTVFLLPTVCMCFCYAKIIYVLWKRTKTCSPKTKVTRLSGKLQSPPSPDTWENRKNNSTNSEASPMALSNLNPSSQGTYKNKYHVVFSDGKRNALSIDRQSSKTMSRKNNNIELTESHKIQPPSKLLSRAKIKAVFMSLTVLLAFLICRGPYFTIVLFQIFSDSPPSRLTKVAIDVSEKLFLMHSFLNPILYFLFATKWSPAHFLRGMCVQCCKSLFCRLQNEAQIYVSVERDAAPVNNPVPVFFESSVSYDMYLPEKKSPRHNNMVTHLVVNGGE